jgi:hypothetical protein
MDNHSVVAVCDNGTPDRAWFYVTIIDCMRKSEDPEWFVLEDWEYRQHNGTELMVLKANGTSYIWKLTHRYGDNQRFGVWVD